MDDDDLIRQQKELDRLQIRGSGFWGGWLLLGMTLIIFAVLMINRPVETRHVIGFVEDIRPDTAGTSQAEIRIEGDTVAWVDVISPVESGSLLCLKESRSRILGTYHYEATSRAMCE